MFIKKSENGSFDNPQIGDLRVSYYVLRSGFDGTIFGKLSGDKIDPYFDQSGNKLYGLFIGTRDQAINMLHSDYTKLLWILRMVGFLLMWFGLVALFGPISVVLDFLPIFGTISRSIIGIITFLAAFVLTIVTILISMIVHSLIVLIVVLAITIGAIIAYFKIIKNKKKMNSVVATTIMTNSVQSTPLISQLEKYVREARARGMTDDHIRQELLVSGWSNDDITQILG